MRHMFRTRILTTLIGYSLPAIFAAFSLAAESNLRRPLVVIILGPPGRSSLLVRGAANAPPQSRHWAQRDQNAEILSAISRIKLNFNRSHPILYAVPVLEPV